MSTARRNKLRAALLDANLKPCIKMLMLKALMGARHMEEIRERERRAEDEARRAEDERRRVVDERRRREDEDRERR